MSTVTSKKITGRRAAAKLDKERRIRTAALELFRQNGYEKTTTKEIAERADVGTGTLFLYVSDKGELLYLIFRERLMAAIDKAFERLRPGKPLVDRLLAVFGALFEVYRDDPALARHFVREQLFSDSAKYKQAAGEFRDLFLARLTLLIAAEQEEGNIDPGLDAGFLAAMSFGLYFNALTAWLVGAADYATAKDRLLRGTLTVQFRGLEPAKKGKRP